MFKSNPRTFRSACILRKEQVGYLFSQTYVQKVIVWFISSLIITLSYHIPSIPCPEFSVVLSVFKKNIKSIPIVRVILRIGNLFLNTLKKLKVL